jgi:hypothetical protein
MRDHAGFLGQLIESEKQAKTWEPSRWQRIWRAASDRAIATALIIFGSVAATLLGAILLRELLK